MSAKKSPVTLIDRVRTALAKEPTLEEKKMFGSVGFMVRDKLCIGARETRLMCRIDPELQPALVKEKGVRAMVMRGKKLKGYVHVSAEVLTTATQLKRWIKLVMDENRRITSSR
jgi:TfoX/Sxy family transcriptional regulator of competence genes